MVSEPLLEGILGKTADEAKSFSSLSGFLFSVGCLVGSVLLGPLTKYVGMVRLTYIMEFFNIATLLLLTMKNLTLIMILRFVAGFLGGLSISLLPLICNSLFPGSKAAIGGGGTYLTLVVFILVASLQNIIFGGIEGLKNNLWLVYVWPIAIAVIRIILMTIFLIRVETPKYLTEFFNGSEEERKSKLLQSFKLVYEESSAKEITEKTLAGLKNSTGGNSSSS